MHATSGSASNVELEFLESSRTFIKDDFLPKLLYCIERMTDEEIWRRPNDASNSVGNLILHLAGNMRQWIVGALSGAGFVRDRDAEFAARGPIPRQELASMIQNAVADVDRVLESLPPDRLLERHRIQKYDVTALQAIYHVVEHFSYHLGQIVYVYKLTTAADPGFYRDLSTRKSARTSKTSSRIRSG